MFKEAEDLIEEMRRLHLQAERHFSHPFVPSKIYSSAEGKWQPLADLYETDDAWVIKIELAGVQKGDFSVSAQEGILTVKGIKRDEFKGRWRTYHQAEINYNEFERAFALPRGIKEEGIKASYKDGLLTITLTKPSSLPAEKAPLTIEITK